MSLREVKYRVWCQWHPMQWTTEGLDAGAALGFGEEELEGTDVDRLEEVVIKTGFASALPVFRLAPAGEGDEDRVFANGKLAGSPRYFVAAHAWHAEVQEHDSRAKRFHHIEGR